MSRKLHLSMARGDYEMIRVPKEGSVQPDGIESDDRTSDIRHRRMLRNRGFKLATLFKPNSWVYAK